MILVLLIVVGLAVSYGYVTSDSTRPKRSSSCGWDAKRSAFDPFGNDQPVRLRPGFARKRNRLRPAIAAKRGDRRRGRRRDQPDVILEKQPATWLTPIVAAVDPCTSTVRDLAIRNFRSGSSSAAERNSVITISYQSYSPDLSRKALEAHARRGRATPASQSDRRLGQVLRRTVRAAHRQLARPRAGISRLQTRDGVSNFDLQRNIVVNRAATLKSSLLDAETQCTRRRGPDRPARIRSRSANPNNWSSPKSPACRIARRKKCDSSSTRCN